MSLAPERIDFASISRRPWMADAIAREPKDGPYAEFNAWEAWFGVFDDRLPEDEILILDCLTGTQKAYLFNLMGRLADGEFAPEASRS